MVAAGVRLVTRPRPEITDEDWRWLARWLGEVLGVPVRSLVTVDPAPAGEPGAEIWYGDRRFLESGRAGPGTFLVEATGNDWLLSANALRRRTAGEPRQGPTTASIDRAVAEVGVWLDRHHRGLARIPTWPPPYGWGLVLTHDVDMVDRWTLAHVVHLARHVPERWLSEGARALLRLPWALVRRVWDRPQFARLLRECIEVERRHGVAATYLFFAPWWRHRTAFDGWYRAATPLGGSLTVERLWEKLVSAGSEVGLHLSIGAYGDPERIEDEWGSLRARIPSLTSYRSHYLAERIAVTQPALATLGAQVDLNLVSSGFAAGTGFPFGLGPGADGLYRVPTVIDDAALEMGGGEPAVRARFWERCQTILDEARRNGSLATILLHPGNPGVTEMTERCIDWGQTQGAWIVTARELIVHWKTRARAVLERTMASPAVATGAGSR